MRCQGRRAQGWGRWWAAKPSSPCYPPRPQNPPKGHSWHTETLVLYLPFFLEVSANLSLPMDSFLHKVCPSVVSFEQSSVATTSWIAQVYLNQLLFCNVQYHTLCITAQTAYGAKLTVVYLIKSVKLQAQSCFLADVLSHMLCLTAPVAFHPAGVTASDSLCPLRSSYTPSAPKPDADGFILAFHAFLLSPKDGSLLLKPDG